VRRSDIINVLGTVRAIPVVVLHSTAFHSIEGKDRDDARWGKSATAGPLKLHRYRERILLHFCFSAGMQLLIVI
jgi:hypothetical protein